MIGRKTSRTARLFLAIGAIATACVAAPQTAEACGGGWHPSFNEPEIDYRIEGVARAEKQLESGKHIDAAATVVRMIPYIRDYRGISKDSIAARAQRVLAVATARAEGSPDRAFEDQVPWYIRGQWGGTSAEQADANLSWAVEILRAFDAQKKNDPAIQSELGEALAKSESTQGEALELLEKLADKDLLTSPEAYAELAKLRADDGDEDGEIVALLRCKAMAPEANMCDVAVPYYGNS